MCMVVSTPTQLKSPSCSAVSPVFQKQSGEETILKCVLGTNVVILESLPWSFLSMCQPDILTPHLIFGSYWSVTCSWAPARTASSKAQRSCCSCPKHVLFFVELDHSLCFVSLRVPQRKEIYYEGLPHAIMEA